jgi:hypothetical protein
LVRLRPTLGMLTGVAARVGPRIRRQRVHLRHPRRGSAGHGSGHSRGLHTLRADPLMRKGGGPEKPAARSVGRPQARPQRPGRRRGA